MAQISYVISHPEYMYIPRYEESRGKEASDTCARVNGLPENGAGVNGTPYVVGNPAETLFGCDQDWYKVEWRRRAGCGPVAATNILFYLRKKYGMEEIPYKSGSVEEALSAMNDVFTYVRPTRRGLHTVRKFVNGMGKFGLSYGLSIKYRYLLVPPQTEKRPRFNEIIDFIMQGLAEDVPVAFLNLHAGAVEEQLSSWHWVTVVGMNKMVDTADNVENKVTGAVNTDTVTLHFFDQSKRLEVDLGKWLRTTENGGGFAYFYKPSLRRTKNPDVNLS